MAKSTALTRARQTQQIRDEFLHLIAINPDHAEDSAWMITATAYTLGLDEKTVRKVWMDHQHIGGVN